LPNKRYASDGVRLHHHHARQLYAEWPSESLDRNQGIDTAYLQPIQLIYGQSRDHRHLLQNFDLMGCHESHHRLQIWGDLSLDNFYVGSQMYFRLHFLLSSNPKG
jgi:hypothetical protein